MDVKSVLVIASGGTQDFTGVAVDSVDDVLRVDVVDANFFQRTDQMINKQGQVFLIDSPTLMSLSKQDIIFRNGTIESDAEELLLHVSQFFQGSMHKKRTQQWIEKYFLVKKWD